jgi:hypothetical protein
MHRAMRRSGVVMTVGAFVAAGNGELDESAIYSLLDGSDAT